MTKHDLVAKIANGNPQSEVMVIIKVQTSDGAVEQQCTVTEALVSSYQDAPVVIYAEPMEPKEK